MYFPILRKFFHNPHGFAKVATLKITPPITAAPATLPTTTPATPPELKVAFGLKQAPFYNYHPFKQLKQVYPLLGMQPA